MPATKALFMPARLTALVCCLIVTSVFAASGAIGWYYVWAYQHNVEPYESQQPRAVIIAGVQGSFCSLIVAESVYGFISLLSNRKGPIRWYLWLSWITFFLGCIATAGTSVLIWVFHFGVTDCTTNSSGKVTCTDLQLGFKIALTVVAALGCWIQSYMPSVLRVVYSRFAAQEILSNKLEPEAFEESPRLPQAVDRGYMYGSPEVGANPQAVQLIKGSANAV